jgi:preprotein translocase subunit SecD
LLAFNILHDQMSSGDRHISTLEFPNLGYVRKDPELSFRRVESVTKADVEMGSSTRKAIIVTLAKSDTTELEDFTRQHLGQRVVILFAGTPIDAPRITEPLVGGKFSLTCTNDTQRDDLLQRLQAISAP